MYTLCTYVHVCAYTCAHGGAVKGSVKETHPGLKAKRVKETHCSPAVKETHSGSET